MASAAERQFRRSKLLFIADLIRESLLTPTRGTQYPPLPATAQQLGITFIGHSSFFIELGGKRILVDPVFARFLVVLKRRRKPGIRLRDLPPIDAVLLTHAHMDHLNRPSLRRILRHNRKLGAPAPIAIVPNGVQDLVHSIGFREVRTLSHWDSTDVDALRITATPSRHWGARFFNDQHRGYGGYVLQAGEHSVYHSGDTAYFPGFAEIGQRLQPEVALLPIGAYFPENFRTVHTSPEDALRAFRELGSQYMIPMHYGTFRLSLEPMEEPPVRLMSAAQAEGLADRILILEEGRTRIFSESTHHRPAAPLQLSL